MFGAAAVRKKKQKAKDANAEALKRGPYIKPFGPRLGCHGSMISFFISLKFMHSNAECIVKLQLIHDI